MMALGAEGNGIPGLAAGPDEMSANDVSALELAALPMLPCLRIALKGACVRTIRTLARGADNLAE